MAGQGIQRREVLCILGTAAAMFPGFSKWEFACGHVGNAALSIRPASYHPTFFSGSEYATVERLAEMIIPSDKTPGAEEAGVAEFIDFMVAGDPEVQYPFRMGPTWLNAGHDPKKFVTNRFGQAHDVSNLYICEASVFLTCTDGTTTISILAFTLRTSEHLIENLRRGEHQSA